MYIKKMTHHRLGHPQVCGRDWLSKSQETCVRDEPNRLVFPSFPTRPGGQQQYKGVLLKVMATS